MVNLLAKMRERGQESPANISSKISPPRPSIHMEALQNTSSEKSNDRDDDDVTPKPLKPVHFNLEDYVYEVHYSAPKAPMKPSRLGSSSTAAQSVSSLLKSMDLEALKSAEAAADSAFKRTLEGSGSNKPATSKEKDSNSPLVMKKLWETLNGSEE